MHTTKSDALVSLNNQQKTDGRGLGFQSELQTPSGLQGRAAGPTDQVEVSPSASEPGDRAPKSWLGTLLTVWGAPLKKAVSGAVLLVFVAYLGHVSDRLESYGPVRALDERVVALFDTSRAAVSHLGAASPTSAYSSSSPGPSGSAAGNAPAPLTQTAPVTSPPGCPKATETGSSARLSDGRIVLNEASVAELDSLPGIGAARAQAIVDLRDKLKGFKKLSDLLRIRGIGHKSFLKLKEQLVLDRPPPSSPAEPPTETEPTPDRSSVDQPDPSAPASKGDSRAQVATAPTLGKPLVTAMIGLGEPTALAP